MKIKTIVISVVSLLAISSIVYYVVQNNKAKAKSEKEQSDANIKHMIEDNINQPPV